MRGEGIVAVFLGFVVYGVSHALVIGGWQFEVALLEKNGGKKISE